MFFLHSLRRRAFLLAAALLPSLSLAATPEIIEVRKIWDIAPHSAFTDLARWKDAWWCVFREAQGHVGGDGKIRVLTSPDGRQWESAALLEESGIDLRDPKLSVTPDQRLMLTLGGSLYQGGTKLLGRQSRVSFSSDGKVWTPPQKVLTEGDWLWRVTWNEGTAYGVSYRTTAPDGAEPNDWALTLYRSTDGLDWQKVAPLAVPGQPNETTLRFRPDQEAVALVRREGADRQAWLGTARPPYTEWQWRPVGRFIGGPNFLFTATGGIIAAGRDLTGKARTAVGPITEEGWTPATMLPSGGDTSYAGLVEHEDTLWVSYYSSHEGKSAIYIARVR